MGVCKCLPCRCLPCSLLRRCPQMGLCKLLVDYMFGEMIGLEWLCSQFEERITCSSGGVVLPEDVTIEAIVVVMVL